MLIKKCRTLVLLVVMSGSQIAAATNSKPCQPSDWTCHNSFFITGGYVFYHTLYKDNPLSIVQPGHQAIDFTPQSAYPNNENALRSGFGAGLGDHTPFSYELDYTQGFPKSKTGSELELTRARKVFSTSINYTLNPESRLRFNLTGGASVTSIYLTTTTVAEQPSFSTTVNTVDVDPFVGGSIVYSINSKFAARLIQYFSFANYNRNTNGSLITLLMLNYYPGAV